MKGSVPMGDQIPCVPRTAGPLGQTSDLVYAQESVTWINGTVALGSCLELCCPLHLCLGNEGVHEALQHLVNMQQQHLWCSGVFPLKGRTQVLPPLEDYGRGGRAHHQSLDRGGCRTTCPGAAKSPPAAQSHWP